MGCGNDMQIWIPKGFSYKEITTKCGSTGIRGEQQLCDKCERQMEKRYPQGWKDTPGDICPHGNYVGDAGGPDYLCPICEGW